MIISQVAPVSPWKSVKNRGEIHWESVNLCGFSCLFRAKTVNLQSNT